MSSYVPLRAGNDEMVRLEEAAHVRRSQRWPASIELVRHGESLGNVARDAAEAGSSPFIDIAERDMDVALSDRGREQARAVGVWQQAKSRRPQVVLSSPYVRAAQ